MTRALVAEPYSSVQVQTGALPAVFTQKAAYRVLGRLAPGGTVTSRRGHETHLHDYTRPPASLGDEVGGLITSLGLFASPLLILSTESVVVMEWKGIEHVNCSIHCEVYTAYRERPPALQSPCSCPSTPRPRLIRSRVSMGGLQRASARCSIRPLHRPYT